MAGNKDIDFMVYGGGLSGLDFAKYVIKYLNEVKHEQSGNIGIISANPDRSKHLETATLKIYGQNVDFSGPRLEVYNDVSRVPEIKPATPKEDAMRRDLSLNSIFYNISSEEIEDYTGHGIDDLKNGILRAPGNTKQMLLDDPLRLLRIIRFHSKLGFELDPEIVEAAKDPEVLEAFKTKLSRERIEIELRKMLSGPDPVRAARLLAELGLRDEVFKAPEGLEKWELDQQSSFHDFNVWDHTLEALTNLQEIIKDRNLNEADKFILNLTILMHDLGKLDPSIPEAKEVEGKIYKMFKGHEAVSMKIAEHMLRLLPGIRVDEIERVKKLIDATQRINPQRKENAEEVTRKQLGKLVRLFEDDYENAIDIAMADSSGHKKDQFKTFDPTYYHGLKQRIKDLDLSQVHKMKPILDGNEVMKLFGRKPGKWVGEINKELIDFQLENPSATKQDAEVFVKKIYTERGLDKMANTLSKRIAKTFTIKAPKISEEDVDPKELERGIEVELEHTNDRELAKMIALHHLDEDPKYYTNLKKVHKESSHSLSKRAEKTDSWWLSPSNELIRAPHGHKEFVIEHPEIFGALDDLSEDTFTIYDAAFDKGWIRISVLHNYINFNVPGRFSNSFLYRLQSILKNFQRVKEITVADDYNMSSFPYPIFLGVQDIGELRRLEREADKHLGLSKRAEEYVKKCGCGKVYRTNEEFLAQPFKGKVYSGPMEEDPGFQCVEKEFGTPYEYDLIYRDCDCESTLAIEIPCIYKKEFSKRAKKGEKVLENIVIKYIDGKKVREKDVEFCIGGHHFRYDFIPENEVWIEDVFRDKLDFTADLVHELVERTLMKHLGYEYEDAHDMANVIETEVRKNKLSKKAKISEEAQKEIDDLKKNPIINKEYSTKIKQVELWHGVNSPEALQEVNGKFILTANPKSDMKKIWFAPAWGEGKQVAFGYADYAMVKIKIPFEFTKVKVTRQNGETREHTESYKPLDPRFERSHQVQEWYLTDSPLELNASQVFNMNEMIESEVSKYGSLSKRSKEEKQSAGVFIVLPDKLAKQFKSLGEHDDSKPHVTALYIGEVPKKKQDMLKKIIKAILKEQEPFELKLDDKVTYFDATEHSDNCKVAKLNIISKDLHKFHDKLKKEISSAGIDIDDHFPDYKPHCTLEYMEPPKEKYDDNIPSGSWKLESVEIWGCGDKQRVRLKTSSISKRAKDPLAKYKSKRDFDETPEPEGNAEKGKNKHRFVIQKHDADIAKLHFDLRLENDSGAMSSWAVPKHKLPKEGEKLLAQKVEDHPLSYRTFSGKIEEGYGKGDVKIHDSGVYEEIEWSAGKIKFKLNGKKEKGTYVLVKTDGKRWLLMPYKEE